MAIVLSPAFAAGQTAPAERETDPAALQKFLKDPNTEVGRDPHGDFRKSIDYLQIGSPIQVGAATGCSYHSTRTASSGVKKTYATNSVQCRKYIVEGVVDTGDAAVAEVPKSSYPQVCSAGLKPGQARETTCYFAASGDEQHLHFRVDFKDAMDASATVVASLDGHDVTCDPGSVMRLSATNANPALYCRVTIKEAAASQHTAVFKSQWSNAAIVGTQFAIE